MLAVCLITYNHAEYVRDALDGILMQEVNVKWKLIIADDGSEDGTQDILREYKRMHPDLIELIIQEVNVGAAQNWLDLISAADSKYIAYMEGDDFWTDKSKLQLQMDYLESNSGCVACGTNSITRAPYGDFIFRKRINENKHYYLHDLIRGNPIQTCTIMFRNCGKLPSYFKHVHSGDMHLWWFLAKDGGYIANLARVTSIYRFHGKGRHSGVHKTKVALNGLCDRLVFLNHNYSSALHRAVLKTYVFFTGVSIVRFLLRRPSASFGVILSHALSSLIALKSLIFKKSIKQFISKHH